MGWNGRALLCMLLVAMSVASQGHAIQLAAGGSHSALLRDDGSVWTWGSNRYGQLGDGGTISRSTQAQVLVGAITVAAGGSHTIAVKADGSLWAWGLNGNGQLGDGTTKNRATPVLVLTGVRAVAAGGAHTLAVKVDGTLWAWGAGADGQLGDGGTSDRLMPVQVLSAVKAVAASGPWSLAIRSDGTLWWWGGGDRIAVGGGGVGVDGCLAVGRGMTETARASSTAASSAGPTLNWTLPALLLSDVIAAAQGDGYGIAIKTDGTLWTWSYSELGPSAAVQILSGVRAVAAARFHFMAVRTDGTLWAWGANPNGEVGDGTTVGRPDPVQVYAGVQAIAAGDFHSLAAKSDGTLWAWGDNSTGQLGDGATLNRPTPTTVLTATQAIAAGGQRTLAVKTDGTVWAWGLNTQGQLGDGSVLSRPTPVQVLTNARIVAAGYNHSLAVKTDNSLWVWGRNAEGQLGDATLASRYQPVRMLCDVRTVAAGAAHSVAVKTDGTLWAWGAGSEGQLGDGSGNLQKKPVQVMIAVQAAAAGDLHTLAIKADGTLWAWGSNAYGQLGDGSTLKRFAPVKVLDGVSAVAAGRTHTVAIKTDGTLWAWGGNDGGQLGDGTTTDRASPVQVLSRVQAVAAGDGHTLAIRTDGTLWAWGSNYAGLQGPGVSGSSQLLPRQNAFLRNIARVAAGSTHAVAAAADGRVLVWGDNTFEQLGIARVTSSSTPLQVRDPLGPYAGSDLVVEYFNATIRNGAGRTGIGHYFITSQAAEALSIDNGGSGPGWSRTGRTFRVWNDPAKAPAGAVAVCRFYAQQPNSHFFTASADECESLKRLNPTNDARLGWRFEGIAFYTVMPSGDTCPVAYFPVYRSYNNRFKPDPAFNDGNHRLTPSYGDYRRSTDFFGYADEHVAFCSPASPNSGGDLQVTYAYPGPVVQSGAAVSVEFLFGNNGAGKGDGAIVYALLPPEVDHWNVACIPRLGAECPGSLEVDLLRSGQVVATWPAGGGFILTATGIAPQVTSGGDATLNFAATVAYASGSPDANTANNTPPGAQSVVKAAAACNYVLNPSTIALGPDAQSAQVSLLASTGCAWNVQGGPSWLDVSPAIGAGDATLTLTSQPNAVAGARIGSLSVNGQVVQVTQAGKAAPTDACATLHLQREGDPIPATGLSGETSFSVYADSECEWNAESDVYWVTLTSGASGRGNGGVSFALTQRNPETEVRTATITVGGRSFTVNQLGQDPAQNPSYNDGGGDGASGGGGGSSGGGAG